MLLESLLNSTRKHQLLHAGDRLGVAVSGGKDSVALLRLLLDARDELGIVLSVVHFNHKIRGHDAQQDERFVAALAHQHDLHLHSTSADTREFAQQSRMSLEAAGRKLRHQFFRQLFAESALDKIATAHTMDDQAETVLLRILRGAGTRGLAGIYPQLFVAPGKTIVRPLLGVRRSELAEYLTQIGQPWREDTSNLDIRFLRNRVRHRLIPTLEQEFQPGIVSTLAELADVAREEESFWSRELASAQVRARLKISRAAKTTSPGEIGSQQAVVLNARELRLAPLAMQRRLIRAAAEDLGLSLEFRHVQEILDLMGQRSSIATKGIELPSGHLAELSGGELRIEKRCPKRMQEPGGHGYDYVLPVPGEVRVPELGVVFRARHVVPNQEEQGLARCLLASDRLHELRVRNWCPGDRFWPVHTKSPKKVKELLQQRKISGATRPLWPVVTSGTEIIWMRGFSISANYFAQPGSTEAILIEELPE
ncbi:MAG TPA: tRNA lysidine(34) synthetase TilS [Terriglobales bacterium]|nr:tRNA lysidine(34) synthetase TilS [Terriglobales bacterium]